MSGPSPTALRGDFTRAAAKGDRGRQVSRTPRLLARGIVERFGVDLDCNATLVDRVARRFIGPPGYARTLQYRVEGALVGAERDDMVAEDALAAWTRWARHGRVGFSNPPFRQIDGFVDKALEAFDEGMQVALLIPDEVTSCARRRLLDARPTLYRFASPDGKASGRFSFEVGADDVAFASGPAFGCCVYHLDPRSVRGRRARGEPVGATFLVHPETFEVL